MTTFKHGLLANSRPFRFMSLFVLLFTLFAFPVSAAPGDKDVFVQTYERDVFVIVGSTLRNPGESTDPAQPLFNVAGVNLNVTWGAWQAANATASAQVIGGPQTDVRIEFTGLKPGGIYSVFYGTIGPDSENPLCPNVERTLALTSKKAELPGPDASSFVAKADGTASYRGRVDGDLLAPQQLFYSIIYHSNNETYDPLPNAGESETQGDSCRSSFGEDAMRQLIIFQKGL